MDNTSELEQMQKDKRKQWLMIQNEASVIIEELYKEDVGTISDKIKLRRAVVKGLTRIKRGEEGL